MSYRALPSPIRCPRCGVSEVGIACRFCGISKLKVSR